jgi:hypothetical protein
VETPASFDTSRMVIAIVKPRITCVRVHTIVVVQNKAV